MTRNIDLNQDVSIAQAIIKGLPQGGVVINFFRFGHDIGEIHEGQDIANPLQVTDVQAVDPVDQIPEKLMQVDPNSTVSITRMSEDFKERFHAIFQEIPEPRIYNLVRFGFESAASNSRVLREDIIKYLGMKRSAGYSWLRKFGLGKQWTE